LRVFWYGADIKDSAKIVSLHKVLDALLEAKKRGVLKKHHGKTAHQAIMQGVVDFCVLAQIVDSVKSIRQHPPEGVEAEMFFQVHPGNDQVIRIFDKFPNLSMGYGCADQGECTRTYLPEQKTDLDYMFIHPDLRS
jgi:hypothetical protein